MFLVYSERSEIFYFAGVFKKKSEINATLHILQSCPVDQIVFFFQPILATYVWHPWSTSSCSVLEISIHSAVCQEESVLRLDRKRNIFPIEHAVLCCSSFGKFKPNKLIATNSLSSFHRCTRSIAPPVLVLRKPSKSLQPGSCLTRPFRLQLPTLQPMLHPTLLAGPSKLIHKQMWYTCSVLI